MLMVAKSVDRLLNGRKNISVPMGLQDEAKNYIKILSKITKRNECFLHGYDSGSRMSSFDG
jgi:hypothetical protein